jgi:chloramphenicol-sensitive protein RarD
MNTTTKGFLAALTTFFLWGFFPVYWKSLQHVPAVEILAHRIVWSFVFTFLIIVSSRKRSDLSFSKELVATAFLISANWLIYIWAVNAGRIVEASLGYFINPLATVLLGLFFLRERLDRRQGSALVLAGIGLIFLTWRLGRMPWVALLLAFTLAFYGLLRKVVEADSLPGLFFETALLSPFALAYIFYLALRSSGAFTLADPRTDLLLAGGGLITSTTLLLFVYGARRLRYGTVGFLQYLLPTMQLMVGVFIYGEPFTPDHALSFGFVWVAVVLYSWSSIRKRRRGDTAATS